MSAHTKPKCDALIMRRALQTFSMLALLICLSAAADDPDRVFEDRIYESVDGVAIGRVFLSPDERARLDAIRHLPQGAAEVSAGGDNAPVQEEPVSPKGIGYIQSGDKAARVFRDGDFVTAPVSEAGVNALSSGIIVRHEAEEAEDATGEEP